VIAVLQTKGQAGMGMDQDDLVLIPLRTFQRRISGDRHISSLMIGIRPDSLSSTVSSHVERLLRERRRIQPHQENDFMVWDPQELISTLTGTTRLLTMLLGAVAAVSLLVGGIGIMNIMLVSVIRRELRLTGRSRRADGTYLHVISAGGNRTDPRRRWSQRSLTGAAVFVWVYIVKEAGLPDDRPASAALPDPREAGRGRDGCGVQSPRHAPGPLRRHQGLAA
jgi:hypothetical protein